MDKEEAVLKAREYVKLAKNVFPYDRAVLFGSHARGNAPEYSDIDVGFFLSALGKNVDYLNLLQQLYSLAEGIDACIEPHVIIPSEDKSGFAREVESTGIVLGD